MNFFTTHSRLQPSTRWQRLLFHGAGAIRKLKQSAVPLIVSALLVLFSILPSQAEILLQASHRIVSSEATAQGFLSKIELTILNSDAALTAVSLQPIDPMMQGDTPQILAVDSLPANAEVTTSWSVTSRVPPEIYFSGMPLIFLGDASDAAGNRVDISLHSIGTMAP